MYLWPVGHRGCNNGDNVDITTDSIGLIYLIAIGAGKGQAGC